MALLSRSVLATCALAATTTLLVATPGSAYSGCPFSKLAAPGSAAGTPGLDGGTGTGLTASPDTNALGVALAGLGAIAALLVGGTAVVRHHRVGATPVTEAEFALDTETVVLPDTPRVETPEAEVALAVRR